MKSRSSYWREARSGKRGIPIGDVTAETSLPVANGGSATTPGQRVRHSADLALISCGSGPRLDTFTGSPASYRDGWHSVSADFFKIAKDHGINGLSGFVPYTRVL